MVAAAQVGSHMRDLLFISHANPEDNEFSLWLALQLAKLGYTVWLDETRLLGGEDFWGRAEDAIRSRAGKVLYVLSSVSNRKNGPLQELQVAKSVERTEGITDFVVPLKTDDLAYSEMNIQLTRLKAIDFSPGWARGLRELVNVLEQAAFPKQPCITPGIVAQWWSQHRMFSDSVSQQTEDYTSNWFPIDSLPPTIKFHRLTRRGVGMIRVEGTLPYPAVQHEAHLITFAFADDLSEHLDADLSIKSTDDYSLQDFLSGGTPSLGEGKLANNILVQLIRISWEKYAESRGLHPYQLSSGFKAYYFPVGLVENGRVYPSSESERSFPRQVVGTRKGYDSDDSIVRTRHWHFALQARPAISPTIHLAVKSHVLFSWDGNTIWTSKSRLHKARRSLCKDWWNDDWRDRLLGAAAWLGGYNTHLLLPVSSKHCLQVSVRPMAFRSPVSYKEPERVTGREDVEDKDETIEPIDSAFEPEEGEV